MIRDPSDGSVREKPVDQKVGNTHLKGKNDSDIKSVIASTTSGLPFGSQKPENIARLERSREWLKNYRKGIINARGSNDQEYPPAGNSSDEERPAES